MSKWTFDRSQLVKSLDKLKPLIGNKMDPICDNVRFSILPVDGDLKKADVFLYGARVEANTCLNFCRIESEHDIGEDHFLLDLKRLTKVLKASDRQSVTIERTQSPEYLGEEITVMGEYTVATEGLNKFRTMDIRRFPVEDFTQGHLLVAFPAGVLPDVWRKAEVARGELDLRYSCLHWDGNLCTLDGKIFCMVAPETQFVENADRSKYFSLNLDSNVSSIIKEMVGNVTVKCSANRSKIFFIDEQTGIFFVLAASTPNKIPYEKILQPDDCDYNRGFNCSREQMISALNRAIIYIDDSHDSRVTIETVSDGMDMPQLKISVRSELGEYVEQIPIEDLTEQLRGRYPAKNLFKAVQNFEGERIKINWRVRDRDNSSDRSLLMTETMNGYTHYQFVISQI